MLNALISTIMWYFFKLILLLQIVLFMFNVTFAIPVNKTVNTENKVSLENTTLKRCKYITFTDNNLKYVFLIFSGTTVSFIC